MASRILVIDDEPELVQLIRIFLMRAGFEVASANNGQQALEILDDVRPDLIICDMVMPGLDGVATVKALRSDPKWQDIPIIMLSARGQSSDVELALSSGANDYITKPFRGSDVVKTVQSYLSESTAHVVHAPSNGSHN